MNELLTHAGSEMYPLSDVERQQFKEIVCSIGGEALIGVRAEKDDPVTLPDELDPSKREPDDDGNVEPIIIAQPSK